MTTTMIITNDFPPRIGGIESFVQQICELLISREGHRVVVLTATARGAEELDATLPYDVVRRPGPLLPTPQVAAHARHLMTEHGATRVIFGAAAPLALLAPSLRRAGATRLLAVTHGHETWWATVPIARRQLRRMAGAVDHVSTISAYTTDRIAPALSPESRDRMIRLAPPVDPSMFRPGDRKSPRPQCVAAGRLVPQKGFRILIKAWRGLLDRRAWPSQPELVIIGDGPDRARLRRDVAAAGLGQSVRFIGAVPRQAMVPYLQQAQVFALPVRTRLAGLNPEGLGLTFLEAAACGLPVIAGDSGGAGETLDHGTTGFLIDPDDHHMLTARLDDLLSDPARARDMGAAGRARVLSHYGLDGLRTTLFDALDLTAGD